MLVPFVNNQLIKTVTVKLCKLDSAVEAREYLPLYSIQLLPAVVGWDPWCFVGLRGQMSLKAKLVPFAQRMYKGHGSHHIVQQLFLGKIKNTGHLW